MGARKRSKKKNNPNRHKAFMRLRAEDSTEIFITRNGAEIVLNPMKKFLLGKEYLNEEFKKEVMRKITKYGLGEKKYNELTEGA